MVLQGFVLQEADVDELLRAAKTVEETQLYIDPSYPPDLVSDLLQRTVRLLQVAMEFQYKETENVLNDYNSLREDVQVPMMQHARLPTCKTIWMLLPRQLMEAVLTGPVHRAFPSGI
jgi:hypothetical protein